MVEKGYQRAAVLGGRSVYDYFLNRDLITDMYITIEPLVFGDGLSLFTSIQHTMVRFDLVSVEQLNKQGTVLLHYRNGRRE